jgi:adenylosuccinate synthase
VRAYDPHIDSRVYVDPQANIITEADIAAEAGLVQGIGSTGQGVGLATAGKIVERSSGRLLAGQCADLSRYINPTLEVLDGLYSSNSKIMLEGTQGTGLSLHHGVYPYVTSRDTTAGGCLAESGIPASKVRRTIMVVRTNPIRVASPKDGTSGPMGREIDWSTVSTRAGEPEEVLREREKTTTTKRQRRVAEFDWTLLCRAALLNGPTDIALTFSDYITKSNQDARRFEQLSPETHDLVREIEQTAGCPVSLITTRFHERSIIDRRSW